MLQWLFASVEMNAERAKTYPDYRVAASDGFFMNLAAVCIKLCQPFIQPSAKTWARIDARCWITMYYVAHRVHRVNLVGMLTADII